MDPKAESSRFTTGVQPDPLPTYQELLDEAIELTFPASDPISTGAAMRTKRRIATPMDDTDWELEPDDTPPAHPGSAPTPDES
jgi:hypothetical protein